MTSLTLRLEKRTDGEPGFTVTLREGTPAAPGAELKSVSLPDLAADVRGRLGDARAQLLAETGRLPDIAAHAADVANLMLPGAVRTAWADVIAKARQDVVKWQQTHEQILATPQAPADQRDWASTLPGCRTYLDVADDAGLGDVPWEIADSGAKLFLRGDMPLSRYRVIGDGRRAADPEWQVRILVVVAARNAEAIGASEELDAIRRVLRPVDRVYDVHAIESPSRERLTEAIGKYRPHVLHFIGHGAGDELQLFDGRVNIPWGKDAIQNDLAGSKWTPQVAYLNACRSQDPTAAPTAADEQRIRGIVDALLGMGVLGTIAMQADVRGSAAGKCAAEFYRGLADGDPIDAAAARGRGLVARALGREDSRDPYLPVLTLTVPAETLLTHRSSLSIADVPFVRDRISRFVDRWEERRAVVAAIDEGKSVLVLDGPADIGKSWLLCWTMELFQRRTCDVRYLELSRCTDWLEAFRALRDGNARADGVQAPLGALLHDSFNWKLTNYANGVAEPKGAAAAGEADAAGPLSKIKERQNSAGRGKKAKPVPDFEARVCRAFHEALRPAGRTLVLVLDQLAAGDLAAFSPDQFAVLRDRWLNDLVATGNGQVRVLIAMRTDRRRDYGLEPLPGRFAVVPVPAFGESATKWLLKELFRLKLENDPVGRTLDEAAMLGEMDAELDKWLDESYSGRQLEDALKTLWDGCVRRVKGAKAKGGV